MLFAKTKQSRIWTVGESNVYIAGMDWRTECSKMHEEGLRTLQKTGVLPFRLRAYNEDGSLRRHDLVFENGLNDLSRNILQTMVPKMFREVCLPAALIQSDSWSVHGPRFRAYFGLPVVSSLEQYEKSYLRILKEKFDGTAANLPPEVMSEAILTSIKGPQVMPFIFLTPYKKDAAAHVTFESTKEQAVPWFNLLPDWWDSTIQ